MMKIIATIEGLGSFNICYVLLDRKHIKEANQALTGEIDYNKSELDFGGFIYEK